MTWGRLAAAVSGALPSPADMGLARAASRPNHLYPIEAIGDFFGLGGDMLPPTRAEAMSVPAMAKARHIVCTAARLPLIVTPAGYRATALIDQPDPKRTRQAVLSDTLDDLLFHGAALWRVLERYAPVSSADYGRPRHAERIALHRVTAEPDGSGYRIDDEPVQARDLVWFEGPHEGVLSFGGRALRSAVRLDRAYAATALNPNAATELHQTSGDVMAPEEISELVDTVGGAIRTRGIVFTNSSLELRTHQAQAENLLISGRNAAAIEIARIVGLPSPVIDAYPVGASGTYDNVQDRLREARDIGADAYAAAVTARLSLDDILPRGVTCEFDWDNLLRQDFDRRMAGYQTAITAGVYTAEECRAMEAGPPKEGTSDDA